MVNLKSGSEAMTSLSGKMSVVGNDEADTATKEDTPVSYDIWFNVETSQSSKDFAVSQWSIT